ncbi:MAG: DUF1294 domain-containing protein [Elainella sp. Prado103]|jgi:uncharacterized membrane protein YsdA (DUF1294 family)/cold shock CspA family protein|nr:DUF1294 domain-containing protein [Elainella sp. Prado103]
MKPGLRRGQLKTWKDERGFGFIQPVDGSSEVFLHVSELKDASRRPVVGDTIYYHAIEQAGKVRAVNAFILGARLQRSGASASVRSTRDPSARSDAPLPILPILLLAIFPVIGAIHFAFTTGYFWVLLLYPGVGCISFLLYRDDKDRARQKAWRTSEKTLILWDLFGGWMGGFIAQRMFRHKVSKPSYQFAFWLVVVMHYLGWLVWLIVGKDLIN